MLCTPLLASNDKGMVNRLMSAAPSQDGLECRTTVPVVLRVILGLAAPCEVVVTSTEPLMVPGVLVLSGKSAVEISPNGVTASENTPLKPPEAVAEYCNVSAPEITTAYAVLVTVSVAFTKAPWMTRP